MRDADDHDVVRAGQVGAVVRHHSRRPGRIPSAVQPDHHRPPCGGDARRPHIEVEAVFAHRLAQVERAPFRHEDRVDERRAEAELECVAHSGPRLRFRRRLKAPRARGGRAVRDAPEGLYLVDLQATDFARGRLRRRARRTLRRLCPDATPVQEQPRSHDHAGSDERPPTHHGILQSFGGLLYQLTHTTPPADGVCRQIHPAGTGAGRPELCEPEG